MELKKLRKEHGFTQKQVADSVGIGMQAYSYYEKEQRQAPYQTLCRLADFFDVSVDELLGRTNTPALFDDARVKRPEVLELFDSLTSEQQAKAIAYMHGLIDMAAVQNRGNVNVTFVDERRCKNQ